MSNINVSIDDSQVQAVFSALSEKKQKKALMGGIRKSAQILIRRTKQLIKSKLRNTNKPSRFNGKKMVNGVKFKGDNRELEGKVHIMGDFRLKIFEKGNYKTHPRKTKSRKKVFNGSFRGGRRQYNRIGEGHSTAISKPSIFSSKLRQTQSNKYFQHLQQISRSL